MSSRSEYLDNKRQREYSSSLPYERTILVRTKKWLEHCEKSFSSYDCKYRDSKEIVDNYDDWLYERYEEKVESGYYDY
jgi:hypothetical protein